jgi:hypothetical protein
MQLTDVDLLFWAMSFLGHLTLLSVLLVRRRFRSFPVFSSLVLFNIARTIVLFLIRSHHARTAYFYTFWSAAVIDAGLQFGIIYELSSKVFRPMGEWARDIKGKLLVWIFISATFTSLLTMISKPASRFWVQRLILKGSFFSAAMMSELFVVMVSISVIAGLNWSNHAAKIANGFALYSFTTLVLETVNTCLGLGGNGRLYNDLSRLRIAVYLCCLVYWILSLWRNAPAAEKMPDNVRQQVSALTQALKYKVKTLRSEGEP